MDGALTAGYTGAPGVMSVGGRATPAGGFVSVADKAMYADQMTQDARTVAKLARSGVPFVWTVQVRP